MAKQGHKDRLSAVDASFLAQEKQSSHMHVGALATFDGPPPARAELCAHLEARLGLPSASASPVNGRLSVATRATRVIPRATWTASTMPNSFTDMIVQARLPAWLTRDTRTA